MVQLRSAMLRSTSNTHAASVWRPSGRDGLGSKVPSEQYQIVAVDQLLGVDMAQDLLMPTGGLAADT